MGKYFIIVNKKCQFRLKLFESVTLLVVSNIDLAQMKGALSRFQEPHENQRQRDLLETESGKSPSVRLLPRAPGFPVEGNLPLPAPASCFPLSTPHFLSRSTAFAVSQSSLHMVHTALLSFSHTSHMFISISSLTGFLCLPVPNSYADGLSPSFE